MLNTKVKSLIACMIVLTAFAAGRYTGPKPATTTSETEIKDDSTIKTHTTVVITKAPDGTVKTTETTDQTENKDVTQNKTTVAVAAIKTTKTNISALTALVPENGSRIPRYGVSVSREIIGPVTAGIFGLSSGIVGVSIGINF